MAKLTKMEKEQRKDLLAELNKRGGAVYNFPEYRATIVIVPCIKGRNAKFARIAIAYCSPQDVFKRKRGELVALIDWDWDWCIAVKSCGDLYSDALRIVEVV